MASASLQYVSWKTAFLLFLTSGRRRGDISAIAADRVFAKRDQSEQILYPMLGYIPKIIDAAEANSRFKQITIPAIKQFIGPSQQEPDGLLCPVRAVAHYQHRSKSLRRGRKKLFIPFQEYNRREQSPNALSSWIKSLIRYAYLKVSSHEQSLHSVSVHEIRALASSLAIQGTFSLEDVLQACVWKNNSTFSEFYLMDLTI